MTIRPGILRRHQSIDAIYQVESANGTYYAICYEGFFYLEEEEDFMWGLRTLIIVPFDDELMFEDFVIVFLMFCM